MLNSYDESYTLTGFPNTFFNAYMTKLKKTNIWNDQFDHFFKRLKTEINFMIYMHKKECLFAGDKRAYVRC